MSKQRKQGRWVAERERRDPGGRWSSLIVQTSGLFGAATAYGDTRAECRRRAAAIRDLANKEGW